MKRPLFLIVRASGLLLIALLTLELCARVEDRIRYGAPLAGNYSLESLYTYDALGKWGKPNSSYLKWHMNDLGYRGPALRPGAYRIVCLGSSETFGLYESEEKEWPRQLETFLNHGAADGPFEVVDVAYPGLSAGTALQRLPQILSQLRPRMVVIYPSYTPYIERSTPQPWPPQPPRKAQNHREHFQFRLQGKVETMLKASLPQALQTWIRDRQLKHDAAAGPVMDRLPETNIQAFTQDLDTLVTQLEARGVQLVLSTHANRFGQKVRPEDEQYLIAWNKFFPTLSGPGLLDMERRMSEAVRRVGAQHDAPVVDAANKLPAGGRDFAEFAHFTDAGAHDLAVLVGTQILSEQTSEQTAQQTRAAAK